jgi:hypothetical protein
MDAATRKINKVNSIYLSIYLPFCFCFHFFREEQEGENTVDFAFVIA